MRQTARRVLLWSLVWYVVAQLAVASFKDHWRSIAPLNESWKWPRLRQLVAEEPERPLVLMLGSSRACWGWKAGSLGGLQGPEGRRPLFYNFGIPATGPIHELLFLREMLREGIRPRLLLVEYLPPLLRAPQRGFSSEESFLPAQWMGARELFDISPYLVRPRRKAHEWLIARLAPSYAFRFQIHDQFRQIAFGTPPVFMPPVDESGWCLRPPIPPSAEERATRLKLTREGYEAAMDHFRMGAGPKQALEDLCELCRREQIPFALVVMPESSDFRDWYSPETRAMTDGFLEELSSHYGADIIDANRWVADNDFEDGHHLSILGAELFTYRLRKDIQRLLTRLERSQADVR